MLLSPGRVRVTPPPVARPSPRPARRRAGPRAEVAVFPLDPGDEAWPAWRAALAGRSATTEGWCRPGADVGFPGRGSRTRRRKRGEVVRVPVDDEEREIAI